MAYTVIRTDLMDGTDERTELVSVRYAPSATKTAIENGSAVLLNGLEAGSRTIYVGATPAKNSDPNAIVVIASPEVEYDKKVFDLSTYINVAGKICRAYRLENHAVFSITKEGFGNEDLAPAVGQVVELMAGTKWNNVASLTAGSTQIGKIIDKNVIGNKTFFAIEVDLADAVSGS